MRSKLSRPTVIHSTSIISFFHRLQTRGDDTVPNGRAPPGQCVPQEPRCPHRSAVRGQRMIRLEFADRPCVKGAAPPGPSRLDYKFSSQFRTCDQVVLSPASECLALVAKVGWRQDLRPPCARRLS
jgi:hypothetical protein